jgi:spore germination cell wall hydrolase CwlJ-like protein
MKVNFKHQAAVLAIGLAALLIPVNKTFANEQSYNKADYSLATAYKETKIKQKEKDCLIEALWYESRGESEQGIKAVASVVENRKNSNLYPDTYCRVIKQHRQFSFTLLNKPTAKGIRSRLKASEQQVYARIEQIAEQMLTGRFKPVLARSVLWYTTTSINAGWSQRMRKVAVIGRHKFFAKG